MTKILLAAAIAGAMVVGLAQLEASDDLTNGNAVAVTSGQLTDDDGDGSDDSIGAVSADSGTQPADSDSDADTDTDTSEATESTPPPAPPVDDDEAAGRVDLQSNGSSEIAIVPGVQIAADDADPTLSNGGALVCATIETAIEAVRSSDWPKFEELIYEATPLTSGAEETAIAQLSTDLFALTTDPDPAPALNRMINICVAEGHQL